MKESFYINSASGMFGGFQRSFSEAEFALFGVPYDSTASFRPGARFGPRSIREASTSLETWSWRAGVDYEDVKLHDLGDLAVVHGDTAETIRRVAETAEDIIGTRKTPVMIGGEHSMTLGMVKALKDVTVVSFDAHFDLREEYLSNKLSHACVMRRITEEIGSGSVIVVGPRATFREEMEFVKQKSIKYLSSLEIIRSGTKSATSWLRESLRGAKKIYISIDIDALDPAFAPGTGCPEPEGLSTTALLDILYEIVDSRLVGFDVVEVCPPYDNGGTAAIGAKLIFEVCCMATAQRK